jgi:hypothetical protein
MEQGHAEYVKKSPPGAVSAAAGVRCVGIPDADVRKMVRDNTARLYGFAL